MFRSRLWKDDYESERIDSRANRRIDYRLLKMTILECAYTTRREMALSLFLSLSFYFARAQCRSKNCASLLLFLHRRRKHTIKLTATTLCLLASRARLAYESIHHTRIGKRGKRGARGNIKMSARIVVRLLRRVSLLYSSRFIYPHDVLMRITFAQLRAFTDKTHATVSLSFFLYPIGRILRITYRLFSRVN